MRSKRSLPTLSRRLVTATIMAAALALAVGSDVLGQSPFNPSLERQIWKDLGPWDGLLNNTPSSFFDFFDEYDEYGVPYLYSQTTDFATEFNNLAEGECTFSHNGDWNADGPMPRRCKGPGGIELAPPLGALLNPVGLAADGARIYVADDFNNRVQVFDFDGTPTQLTYPIGNGVPGAGPYADHGGVTGEMLSSPNSVAVDAAHRIVVSDSGNSRMPVFEPDGTLSFQFGLPPHLGFQPVPSVVALSPGATVLPPGSDAPAGAAADHRIVVTDWSHCLVQVFDTRWAPVTALPAGFPSAYDHGACFDPNAGDTGPGEFSTVTGVTIDAENRIYVSDHAQNVVQVFDRDGGHLGWIGKPGPYLPPAALNGPVGLMIDHQGRLGVIDGGNSRVAFYTVDFSGGAPVATFQFQLDITVSVQDFPMGLAEQQGDDTDPKGRFLATDPLRRQVLRFELPELAIVNATADAGSGSFDVVVPKQKIDTVAGVVVTVDPVEAAVTVDAGSLTPSAPVSIPAGALVHYTFTYSTGGSPTATFDINAFGDLDTDPLSPTFNTYLANAPPAAAQSRAACATCGASHAVYFDPPSGAPEPAELIDTPVAGDPDWYAREVFVRITPDVADEPTDDSEVVEVHWYFTGAATGAYGNGITQSPANGGHVDVSNRVGGISTLFYRPVTRAGTAGPWVEVPLNVDLAPPTVHFAPWTAPSGTDPQGRLWYNQAVVAGAYNVTDTDSGTAADAFPAPTPDGEVTFTAEGRDQEQTFEIADYVGRTESVSSATSSGGRYVNIDRGAPAFDEVPAGFDVTMTGQDAGGRYVDLPAGALVLQAADPELADESEGSRPVPFVVPSAAGRYCEVEAVGCPSSLTFTAADYAGNSTTVTVPLVFGKSAPILTYLGQTSVDYGSTLVMRAQVAPSTATGTVTFSVGGRTVVGTLEDVTEDGVTRRMAIAELPRFLSDVGGYTIDLDYSGDAAFEAVSGEGLVAVNKFRVVATTVNSWKYYGAEDPPLTFTSVPAEADLFLESDRFVGADGGDPVPVRWPGEAVGTYGIQQGNIRLNNPNYELLVNEGLFTIVGVVTVNPRPETITYGDPDPAFTFDYGAFPEGLSMADIAVPPTCSAPGPRTAGTHYIIQCAGGQPVEAKVGLLEFSYPFANLTIEKATPTVTVGGGPFIYDGLAHPATCAATGVNGETLTYAITYAGGSVPVNAGSVEVTCTAAESDNHVAASDSTTLVIDARPVTVRGGALTKLVGAADPDLVCSLTGAIPDAGGTCSVVAGSVVGGDTISGVLARDAGETAGTYAIRQGTLSASSNYALSYENGSLTIQAPTLNQPPVAVDDVQAVLGGAPLTIDVLANDSDPDGDPLTIAAVTQPAASAGTVAVVGNMVVFTPAATFAGSATFTYTIADGKGGTDTATVMLVSCSLTGFRTQSQGGWGAPPAGGNAGAFLHANFSAVYGSAGVTIGGTKWLRFTTAQAITRFLPAGGSPGSIKASAVNPASAKDHGGVFAGQVLALQLSVDFSNAGITRAGLGALVLKDGPLAGRTVAEVLAMANAVLGGTPGALPAGLSVSGLNTIVDAINNNFVDGTRNEGYLAVAGCGVLVNSDPVAMNDSLTTAKNTAKTVSVIANDTDTDSDALRIAAVTQPAKGTVVVNANGTLKYIPPQNWTGTTTFTYTIDDGNGGSDTATVTVTVTSGGTKDPKDRDKGHDDDDHDDDDDDHEHERNGICGSSKHFGSWRR